MAAYRRVMTHVTCRLAAKNRDQRRNPTLGNRVWATFFTLMKSVFPFPLSPAPVFCACAAPAGYPRIVESPSLKAVEKGRGTVMICDATGNPEPVISWLKDSVPVDMTDPRLQILPSGLFVCFVYLFIHQSTSRKRSTVSQEKHSLKRIKQHTVVD